MADQIELCAGQIWAPTHYAGDDFGMDRRRVIEVRPDAVRFEAQAFGRWYGPRRCSRAAWDDWVARHNCLAGRSQYGLPNGATDRHGEHSCGASSGR